MELFKNLKTWKKVGLISFVGLIVIMSFGTDNKKSSRSSSSGSSYDSYYDAKCRQCKMDYNKKDEGHVIDGGQIYKASDYGFTSAPYCSFDCALLHKSQRGY